MITLIYGVFKMKYTFRIKEAAKARGVTLSCIAKKLGMPRSNMSAIASGARGVSLKVLIKIGRILGCGIDELIDQGAQENIQVFKDKKVNGIIKVIEDENYSGMDKTWVNRLMLAQRKHYGSVRKGD
jgi:transcriptional regulator with XRE-family HTH domain